MANIIESLGLIIYDMVNSMHDIVGAILGGELYTSVLLTWLNIIHWQVVIIAWLYAMYQQSTKVLIVLVVIFLAVRIPNAVMIAMVMMQISGGKL